MKNIIVFYKEKEELIGLIFLTIGILLVFSWCIFVFSFVLAFGSNGDEGDIVRYGILFIKNYPIMAIISLLYAGFTVYKLKNIF